ncbi:MAG: hypothetical protein NC393_09595 [Clostridium sp.]|nr:hypothetical protein [Clostridium sp.]MCM1207794.1 hypothetical protein [Ruminococcus sp.]
MIEEILLKIEKYYGFKKELIRNVQMDGPLFVNFEVNGIMYSGYVPFVGAIPQLTVNGYTAKHHNEKDVLVEDWYYEKYIKDKPVRLLRYMAVDENDEAKWEDTGVILKNQEDAEKYINSLQLHYEIIID